MIDMKRKTRLETEAEDSPSPPGPRSVFNFLVAGVFLIPPHSSQARPAYIPFMIFCFGSHVFAFYCKQPHFCCILSLSWCRQPLYFVQRVFLSPLVNYGSHQSFSTSKIDNTIFTNYITSPLSMEKLDDSNYDTWASNIQLWLTGQGYKEHLTKN
ncbi:hypothetical protein Lal_00024770 [Lupinus albus]|nr:hypothetical protein Lal_00024770 [Lupinus albus]